MDTKVLKRTIVQVKTTVKLNNTIKITLKSLCQTVEPEYNLYL